MTDRESHQVELLAESERVRVTIERLADQLDAYAQDLLDEQDRREREGRRDE